MSGPIVHTASMQRLTNLLNNDEISVNCGWWIANMKADVDFDSHGWSIEDDTGSIFDKILSVCGMIASLDNLNDIEYFSQLVRYICHFCTDSMTIGQISKELWGKFDNRFDVAGELIWNKNPKEIQNFDFFKTDDIDWLLIHQKDEMKLIYDFNIGYAKKWNYVISSRFANMVRDSVFYGANYAYNWIKWSITDEAKRYFKV